MTHRYLSAGLASCATVFFTLLGFNSSGFAQESAAEAQAASPSLEEVVVTARRREESLQETPVAVSALGESALQEAGIATITDLQQLVPGLQFGESGSKTPAIFIRGIGQREGAAVLDPGVGVYLNGIFIARQDTQLLDTVDTQSIQVLRGPQGTLFGKNNTGGAMLVTTKQPHFEQFEMSLFAKLGENERSDFKFAGNFPILEDRMGLRFALNSKKYKGYNKDLNTGEWYGDEERLAATARLYWEITDTLSADVFTFWSKQNERSSALNCIHQNPDSNISQLLWLGHEEGFIGECNNSEALGINGEVFTNPDKSEIKMTNAMYALTLNWGFENFDVKSITAYSEQFDIVRNDDQDGTDIAAVNNGTTTLNGALVNSGHEPIDESRSQFSQELQISGTAFDDRLSYTTGIFVSREEINENPFAQLIGEKGLTGVRLSTGCAGVFPEPLASSLCGLSDLSELALPLVTFLGTSSSLVNESWAVFAQGTYEITEWLQLTVGGRHTVEERERDLTTYDFDGNEYALRLTSATGTPVVYLGDDVGFFSPVSYDALHNLAETNTIPDLPVIVNASDDIQSEEWRRFTPTVTLSYLAQDNVLDALNLNTGMVYFTWSKGFKAGGFEPRGTELRSFNPEDVENFELGFKLDAVDSTFRFNAAMYHMSYQDIHVRIAEQGAGIADLFLFLSNAGAATIDGAEIEMTYLFGKFMLHATANYTDASYDEFTTTVVIPLEGQMQADRSAEPFALVPEQSFSLALQYNGITPFGAIIPRLSMYHRSEIFTGIDEKAIEYDTSTLDELTLWNARVTWAPSENMSASFYVNNLLDEEYYKSGFAVSALLGAATLVQAEPRTMGLELNYEFF